MFTIFVYGDSNVWGDNLTGPRIPVAERWVRLVETKSGGLIKIIDNAVNGRIAGNYNDEKPEKNGRDTFLPALKAAGAVDLVLIALGTNDLQVRYHRTAQDVLQDLAWYASQTSGIKTAYVLPPSFNLGKSSGPQFTETSEALREMVIKSSSILGTTITLPVINLSDGIHFSRAGHNTVAQEVSNQLKEMTNAR